MAAYCTILSPVGSGTRGRHVVLVPLDGPRRCSDPQRSCPRDGVGLRRSGRGGARASWTKLAHRKVPPSAALGGSPDPAQWISWSSALRELSRLAARRRRHEAPEGSVGK